MRLNFDKSVSRLLLITTILVGVTTASVAFTSQSVFANAELVSEPKMVRLGRALEEMQWQEHLSDDDVIKVLEGLQSRHSSIAETAINVVALHHVAMPPSLIEEAGKKSDAGTALAKIVAQSLRSGTDPVSDLRAQLLQNGTSKEWKADLGYNVTIRNTVGRIVVIDEAKFLRRGEKEKNTLAQVKLTSREQKLLHYSTMPLEEAVDDIFETLGKATVGSTPEYDLVAVLQSYGEPAVLHVMKKFSEQQELNTMTGLGIKLLLQPLAEYVTFHVLDTANADKLNRLVDHLEKSGSPYLAAEIPWLRRAVEHVTKAKDSGGRSRRVTT